MKNVYALFAVLTIMIGFSGNAFTQINAGALPVVLVNFSANITINKKVALSWTTQQQINVDCFDVEKSNDGLSWQSIATVKSPGNSAIPVNYSSVDAFPLKGDNFYRIRIKSINGTVGYTITKAVRMNALGNILAYPNPATNFVNILLAEIPHSGSWSLSVMNAMGQAILQKKYNSNIITVCLPVSNYPDGMYTLVITDGNTVQSKKLMINHK